MLNRLTRTYQEELGRHCRTGEPAAIPGLNHRRAAVYRDLVFGTVESALRRAYPIAASVLGDARWGSLVERFFAEHPLPSPQLWQMPRELITFVSTAPHVVPSDAPFLPDLLRFEWIEIEVAMMPDLATPDHTGAGDVLFDRVLLNPHHLRLTLEYPVYAISSDILDRRGRYELMSFRVPEVWTVRFIGLNPRDAAILDLLTERARPLSDCGAIVGRQHGVKVGDDDLERFGRLLLSERAALGFITEDNHARTVS